MAYKTMLRQLISKWGIMSIEMQSAIDKDMAVIREDGTADYVDNSPEDVYVDSSIVEPVADQADASEPEATPAQQNEAPTTKVEEDFFA